MPGLLDCGFCGGSKHSCRDCTLRGPTELIRAVAAAVDDAIECDRAANLRDIQKRLDDYLNRIDRNGKRPHRIA